MENYKEKYEDALERARVWKEKSGMPVDKQGILDDIFPELKESDDEKIRKTLKSFFDSEISDYGNVEWRNGIRYGEIVSWLEKQGEKIDVIKNFNTEFERQISHLLASTINKEHEYNEGFVKWTANALLNYAKQELGKQGESCYPYQPGWRKNYSDNKPKVKHSVLMFTTHGIAEGEWLGGEWCQYRWSCKIKDEDVLYWLHLSDLENLEKENGEQKLVDKCKDCNNVKGCITCIDGDQYAHITEQKPADKVEPKFKVGDWITIDNPCQIISIDGNYIVQYCDDEETREISKKFCESQFHLWTIQDAKDGDVLYSPCCKLLFIFKNNKECYVGYNLNYHAESVVINSPICIPSDSIPAIKEQRDLFFSKMKEAGYEWDVEKKELKKIEQTYFQKQEWTGYDEKAYEIALLDIDKSPSITKNDTIDWLKSLKNRVQLQLKQEWSEEDEKIIKNLSNIIVANSKNNYLGHYYTPDLITKLQSLRHSRKLLNQEWSEEDEKTLNSILNDLSQDVIPDNEDIQWLKSLKDRYTWKPCDEQMEVLYKYAEQNNHDGSVLTSLYRDLKKLK